MGSETDSGREARDLVHALRDQLEYARMLGMEGFSGEGRESNPGPEPKTSDLTPTETHLAGLLFQDALFEPSLPTGPMPERNPPTDKTLQEIRTDLGDCTRCKLSETRTQIVFGEGNPSARLVFVGEAPGAEEDAQGRPFVGRAGQLLTRMIEAMGMRREDVYICNVIKCRPPENDFSLAIRVGAVAACEGFLHRQLMVIKPKAIVALGNPAVQALLKTKEGITKLRGNWQTYQNVPVMPTYHPAFLLRSPDRKKEVWEDLQKVMALLAEG